MRNAYVASQHVLGAAICVLGVVLVVSTLVHGGGPLALGVIVGACFAALGAARVWLARRRAGVQPPR